MTVSPFPLPSSARAPNVIESLKNHQRPDGQHVLRLTLPGHPAGDHVDLPYRPDNPTENRASLLLVTSRAINGGYTLDPRTLPPSFVQAMRAWAHCLEARAILMELDDCRVDDVDAVRRWANQLLLRFAYDLPS
jgi:hypothetical protein